MPPIQVLTGETLPRRRLGRSPVAVSVTYTTALRVFPPLNRALPSAYLLSLNEPEIKKKALHEPS